MILRRSDPLVQSPVQSLALLATTVMLSLLTAHFFLSLRNTALQFHPAQSTVNLSNAAPFQAPFLQQTLQAGINQIFATGTPQPTLTPTTTSTPLPTFTPTTTSTSSPSPTPLPSPTRTPTPASGTARTSPLDGMISRYVPGGNYKIGQADTYRKVILTGFWINQTPVTNAMYRACESAGVCPTPIRKEINPHYYESKYDNHPAVYITWYYANKYCTWVGASLPTEAQWEVAAGAGKLLYPWGSDYPTAQLANVDNHSSGTREVGSYPNGASLFGVLDMGSNVREWVNDWYGWSFSRNTTIPNAQGPDSGEKKVLKGASWHDPGRFSLVSNRLAHVPGSPGDNRGFRCAFRK